MLGLKTKVCRILSLLHPLCEDKTVMLCFRAQVHNNMYSCRDMFNQQTTETETNVLYMVEMLYIEDALCQQISFVLRTCPH